jgi:hypothetical protein
MKDLVERKITALPTTFTTSTLEEIAKKAIKSLLVTAEGEPAATVFLVTTEVEEDPPPEEAESRVALEHGEAIPLAEDSGSQATAPLGYRRNTRRNHNSPAPPDASDHQTLPPPLAATAGQESEQSTKYTNEEMVALIDIAYAGALPFHLPHWRSDGEGQQPPRDDTQIHQNGEARHGLIFRDALLQLPH